MPGRDEIRKFCGAAYDGAYARRAAELAREYAATSRRGAIPPYRRKALEALAQKEAIRVATTEAVERFPEVDAPDIWRAVYEWHVQRKSGICDSDVIEKVIRADQSWKKSSGHAFEEIVKDRATSALRDSGIEVVLQRDLHALIASRALHNEPRDLRWLKEQIDASAFDLYAIVRATDGRRFCYGCIQSKTSVRDRVARDREPSLQAMRAFFWSALIVLDGSFLKQPKFAAMINGGTPEYEKNGWHGLYVFSDLPARDRIYPIGFDFQRFREHAVIAANYWLAQRQWFNEQWRADAAR